MEENQIYEQIVESIRSSHPHLHETLHKAQSNRIDRLAVRAKGLRLDGLDEWLGYLKNLEAAFESEATLSQVSFLIKRIRDDFETAIEASLSGLHSIVFDTMRDVMEIWMLLQEFAHDPARLPKWLGSSDQELANDFAPRELRRRQAARLGVKREDLPETTDYRGHSRSLHVSPKSFPWERKGIVSKESDEFMTDMCYWEMFGHAKSIAIVVTNLAAALAPGKKIGWDVSTELPRVAKAYEAVMQMQSIFLALLKAANETSAEA